MNWKITSNGRFFQEIKQHIEATKRQIIYENELVYFMKRYDFTI
jgi:hypothetical protein